MHDWRTEVDHWWAEVLRLPGQAMRTGGVYALDHVDHVGVLATDDAPAPVVYGPPRLLPTLHAVAQTSQGNLVDGTDLAAALGRQAGQILGPAWYGYVTEETLALPRSQAVRPLRESDLPLLAALHQRTPPEQVHESGTTGLPGYGCIAGGELLAVACLGTWRQMPTIGVLTDPRARGSGLAALVVTAAAREGLNQRPVVQYRAWHRNKTSIAVAVKCGFAHYCDGVVIELLP